MTNHVVYGMRPEPRSSLRRLRLIVRTMRLVAGILLTLSCVADSVVAQPGGFPDDPPAGKPYVYKESGGVPRSMEIFFPPRHDPARSRAPGLVLFHGGGWTGGSLKQFRVACGYFASRGIVSATVEYRMLGKQDAGRLPAGESLKRVCITDAKSAIRWFKQHAEELGIDPRRIITGGGSAGGHISALATLNPGLDDPRDPPGIDTSVAAYLWFNPAFAAGDDRDPEIDILRHVRADLPPAIVFFGDKDEWKKGWDAAHAKWKNLGCRSIDLQIAPGQPHGFFNRDPWQTITLLAADRFLAKHGLVDGEPTKAMPSGGQRLEASP